ncbi:MAG: hypothetical protein ACJ74H_20665 [Thermoanaerobaculia bacterium]
MLCSHGAAMSSEFTRRDFLATCSVLAASACTTGLRTAASFLADPAYEDYRAPLRALIETVLPPRFPIATDEVERRLLEMFPFEEERRFLGFQKTLVYFDALDLAPHVAAPLLAAERVALDVPERLPEHEFDALCEAKTRIDAQSADAFFTQHGRASHFAPLPPDARAAWLRLWNASEFTVKRDFARSVRNLVCVAAYSSDRVWPAIGYDGPLLPLSPLRGERAGVRGDSYARFAPHPDPLPAKRGEGTETR